MFVLIYYISYELFLWCLLYNINYSFSIHKCLMYRDGYYKEVPQKVYINTEALGLALHSCIPSCGSQILQYSKSHPGSIKLHVLAE